MSKSLPSPWLCESILKILSSDANETHTTTNTLKPRIVQVIKVIEPLNIIIIHDKLNSISIMLTEGCVKKICADYGSLDTLKYSLIKLEKYYFSTTMQCASNRSLEDVLKVAKISVPFTIQCSQLIFLGNSDLSLLTESESLPIDLNLDKKVFDIIFNPSNPVPYLHLVSKLCSYQFSTQSQLPDASMYF